MCPAQDISLPLPERGRQWLKWILEPEHFLSMEKWCLWALVAAERTEAGSSFWGGACVISKIPVWDETRTWAAAWNAWMPVRCQPLAAQLVEMCFCHRSMSVWTLAVNLVLHVRMGNNKLYFLWVGAVEQAQQGQGDFLAKVPYKHVMYLYNTTSKDDCLATGLGFQVADSHDATVWTILKFFRMIESLRKAFVSHWLSCEKEQPASCFMKVHRVQNPTSSMFTNWVLNGKNAMEFWRSALRSG